jgi:hypothetical protein
MITRDKASRLVGAIAGGRLFLSLGHRRLRVGETWELEPSELPAKPLLTALLKASMQAEMPTLGSGYGSRSGLRPSP